MKLRFNTNSIRFRLSKEDIDCLNNSKLVSVSIPFGPKSGDNFSYSIIQTKGSKIDLSYANNHLRLFIPQQLADDWILSEKVGFSERFSLSQECELFILVEKDFQCLQPREFEDETLNFPNPLANRLL
ncbi:MAG: hypothetical protein IPP06_08310 [Saprospiraceae bacterium]|nr:hypothetical protein [Candidatus Vicinibacter affinis]MBP6172084.1 hypothetical protein [Saprospiraceae bacterium]MBK6571143.1 hypothetical protein [Candidatus Vicinibacter affinis]MBK7304880.1 hypothetical protein [Candidatus Vicinibacter affinis]MBK7694644.1 hypothetical protein [Candidatus Vicinibacter affinis]